MRRFFPPLVFATVTAIGGLFAYWLVHTVADAPTDEIASELQQTGSYKAIAEARPRFQTAVRELQRKVRDEPGLLHATNLAIATATVQDTIRQMLATIGGQIRSSQPLPKIHNADFDLIRVQYDIIVPTNRLGDLIYAIETHQPYLFIDSVDIETPQNILQQPNGAASALAQVRWIISSYLAGTS